MESESTKRFNAQGFLKNERRKKCLKTRKTIVWNGSKTCPIINQDISFIWHMTLRTKAWCERIALNIDTQIYKWMHSNTCIHTCAHMWCVCMCVVRFIGQTKEAHYLFWYISCGFLCPTITCKVNAFSWKYGFTKYTIWGLKTMTMIRNNAFFIKKLVLSF